MGLFRAEMASLPQALEELKHPLSLGGEPLAPVVEAAAQTLARPITGIRDIRGIRRALAHGLGPSRVEGGEISREPVKPGPPAEAAEIFSSSPASPAASRSATVTTSR